MISKNLVITAKKSISGNTKKADGIIKTFNNILQGIRIYKYLRVAECIFHFGLGANSTADYTIKPSIVDYFASSFWKIDRTKRETEVK